MILQVPSKDSTQLTMWVIHYMNLFVMLSLLPMYWVRTLWMLALQVGKFYFAMEAFESVVLPLLEPNKAIKLHVIDEVCESSITYISESCFTKDLHWRTIDMDICDRQAHLTMSALLLRFFLWINFWWISVFMEVEVWPNLLCSQVGRMELESERFRDKLMALLASPQVAVRLCA